MNLPSFVLYYSTVAWGAICSVSISTNWSGSTMVTVSWRHILKCETWKHHGLLLTYPAAPLDMQVSLFFPRSGKAQQTLAPTSLFFPLNLNYPLTAKSSRLHLHLLNHNRLPNLCIVIWRRSEQRCPMNENVKFYHNSTWAVSFR